MNYLLTSAPAPPFSIPIPFSVSFPLEAYPAAYATAGYTPHPPIMPPRIGGRSGT